MDILPLHILEPALSGIESASLVNCALVNKNWFDMFKIILKTRALAKETEVNRLIIDKAKAWVFKHDWLLVDDLWLSAATHIHVNNFGKVHEILTTIGNQNRVDGAVLAPLFARTKSFFDTRHLQIDMKSVEQTFLMLVYLRHAYSQDGMYNKDEVAACVFYLMFSYMLIPEISHFIRQHGSLTTKLLLQIAMAKRCFSANFPSPCDGIYADALTKATAELMQ